MPLATDRDPSGVKQKNLPVTTGPQIGNLFLARSSALTCRCRRKAMKEDNIGDAPAVQFRRFRLFAALHKPGTWSDALGKLP